VPQDLTCFLGAVPAEDGSFSGDSVWNRKPRVLRGARGFPSEMEASFWSTERGWLSREPLFTWGTDTQGSKGQTEKDRDRKRDRQVKSSDRDRQTQIDTDTHRKRERDRQRETDREKDRQTDRQKERKGQTESERQQEREGRTDRWRETDRALTGIVIAI